MINNEYIDTSLLPSQQKQPLLQWLQAEANNLNQNRFGYIVQGYTDVLKPKIVYRLLLKINFQYFTKTEIGQFIFQTKAKDYKQLQTTSTKVKKDKIVKLIESYLQQIQCKKFTIQCKKILQSDIQKEQQKNSITKDIIRLILYMAIKSQSKNDFIHRIFSFGEQYQNSLMHEIMTIQNKLQNITQIEEIVNKFNQLSEENIRLKDRLVDTQNYNKKIRNIHQEQSSCIQNLQDVMGAINRQKMSVYEKLDFKTQANLITAYGNLLMRYQKATKICQKKQYEQSQLYDNHIELLNKRNSFQTVSAHLSNQKQKLQQKYLQKKDESFNLSKRFSLKLSKQNRRLQEKDIFSSRYSKKNQDGDSTLISNNSLNNSMNMTFRVGNNSVNQSIDVATKLDQMIIQHQKMKDQLQGLKIQNNFLKKTDKKQCKILNQLKEVFSGLTNYVNGNTSICC